MSNAVWKNHVNTALTRLQEDRWTAPAVRYMEIIDDVAAGRGSAADIARRHGSPDLVTSALGRITAVVHGDGSVPSLDQGGWYESDGERYRVSPEFAAEWQAARSVQTRLQALQAI